MTPTELAKRTLEEDDGAFTDARTLAKIVLIYEEALFVISKTGAGVFAGEESDRHKSHVAKTARAEAAAIAKGES